MTRNLRFRQYRAWLRSPGFYLRKAKDRYLGRDLRFLDAERERFSVGSFEWLVLTELRYGGFQHAKKQGSAQGGDRMSPLHHDYAQTYAQFLKPFLNCDEPLTLGEVGILNGTGLAIWCDLFPNSQILGLDIDLENFKSYLPTLREMGAFQANAPSTHQFDQLDSTNRQTLRGF